MSTLNPLEKYWSNPPYKIIICHMRSFITEDNISYLEFNVLEGSIAVKLEILVGSEIRSKSDSKINKILPSNRSLYIYPRSTAWLTDCLTHWLTDSLICLQNALRNLEESNSSKSSRTPGQRSLEATTWELSLMEYSYIANNNNNNKTKTTNPSTLLSVQT